MPYLRITLSGIIHTEAQDCYLKAQLEKALDPRSIHLHPIILETFSGRFRIGDLSISSVAPGTHPLSQHLNPFKASVSEADLAGTKNCITQAYPESQTPSERVVVSELSQEEAFAKAATRWWETSSPTEVARFQLLEGRLCCPISIYHKAVETCLGRSILTHEFVDPGALLQELDGKRVYRGIEDSIARSLDPDLRVTERRP